MPALSAEQIVERLQTTFGDDIRHVKIDALDPSVEVAPNRVVDVCRFLRDTPDLAFDTLSNLCGVDYLEPDPKRAAKFPHEPHVEVVYHLFSLVHRHRIVLRVRLPRWRDDEPGRLPQVDSVTSVWPAANWHERECFDLMGIEFLGHPRLERILCPSDWVGHPLRKDYEMPLEYHGIRGK
jgi:NADH-quinone oxidoreductase subunit C